MDSPRPDIAAIFATMKAGNDARRRRFGLAERRAAMTAKGAAAWKPAERQRVVSPALRAYAAMTTNAARGAVRDVSQVE